MKIARFIVNFVILSIILSSFSISFGALNTGNVSVTEEDEKKLYRYEVNEKGEPVVDPVTSKNGDLNTFGVEGEHLNDNQGLHFTVNNPGAYTIDLARYSPESELRYTVQVKENGVWKEIRLLAHKEGEGYSLYSPTSSNGGKTITVWLDENREYRVVAKDAVTSALYKFLLYRDPGINGESNQLFRSDINASVRSSGAEKSANLETIPLGTRASSIPEGGKLSSFIGDTVPLEWVKAGAKTLGSLFEQRFVDLLLLIGDYAVNLLGDIFGEDVTISKLIYNRIKLVNPNFFDAGATNTILDIKLKDIVNDWYMFFRGLAIVFYIVAFLMIGVHVIYHSTGNGLEKAKSMVLDWVKGILILFAIPIFMKLIFKINDALIMMLADENGTYLTQGRSFTDGTLWSADAITFRSPKYISKRTGFVQYGSDEVNQSYAERLAEFEKNYDIMKIMRAYAGVTRKLGFCFLWYICIAQLISFIFIYVRRFFMIAFLISVFPITCIFNAISIMRGTKGMQMNTWIKEFMSNVFLQFIHAIIYSIITGVCMGLIIDSLQSQQSTATLNWLVMLISINFIPEGEKILKKLLASLSSGSTSIGASDGSQRVKGAVKNGINHFRQIVGR